MATLVEAPVEKILQLSDQLTNGATDLPVKYRCLFSLRNVAGPEAHKALSRGECAVHAHTRHRMPLLYRRAGRLDRAMLCWPRAQRCKTRRRCCGMRWHSAWASARTRWQCSSSSAYSMTTTSMPCEPWGRWGTCTCTAGCLPGRLPACLAACLPARPAGAPACWQPACSARN